jgi:hypothetical protein
MTSGEASTTDDTRDATGAETERGASEARASQDALTQSVGQRLTRASHDTKQPRWKRWFGKG